MTRVSILTPAYRPTFLAAALRSALAQSHADFELVICDDSGGAEVAAIVREVAGDDPRVRYVRNPSPLGGGGNARRCFELARAPHVKFLNDDDLLAPACLARMSAALDADPTVALVTSYRRLVDARGAALPDTAVNRRLVREDSRLDGRGLLDLLLRHRINVVGEPTTVMFRRADAAALAPHLFSFAGRAAPRNGDTFLWASLLARGDAVYFADPLSSFRQHDDQAQGDPAFVASALAAWEELVALAEAAGLHHPDRPRDLGARPLDPRLGAARARLARLRARARGRAEAGDVPAAARDLSEVLASDPDDAGARSDLACLLWARGEREAALAGWRRALAADPDHVDATANLAEALLAGGAAAAAEAVCRDHLARVPWRQEIRELALRAARAATCGPRRG